eukprot:93563-Amphidinium_carterae.1
MSLQTATSSLTSSQAAVDRTSCQVWDAYVRQVLSTCQRQLLHGAMHVGWRTEVLSSIFYRLVNATPLESCYGKCMQGNFFLMEFLTVPEEEQEKNNMGFVLCYLSGLFAQGLYLPQIISFLRFLPQP